MEIGVDPGHIVFDGDPALPDGRGTLFGPRLLWPNGRPSQQLIQPQYVTNHLADSASCLSVNGNKYWSRDSGSALHWEGNLRSGFALAERHRMCHISTYRLNGLRQGDEHPDYTPVRCIALLF